MTNLARKIRHCEPTFESATVVARGGRALRVRSTSGELDARRAKSCLVQPDLGDEVLIAETDGQYWVLAVLQGEEGAASCLVAEGDVEVQSLRGKVRIGAGHGIVLSAGEEVSIASGTFALHAVDASAVFERMTLIGSTLRADLGAVKAVAGALDSVVERVTQRAKRVYRFVEELEQLRAGVIDYVAAKNASVRGENTVMTATECVKIDGEQVHIG